MGLPRSRLTPSHNLANDKWNVHKRDNPTAAVITTVKDNKKSHTHTKREGERYADTQMKMCDNANSVGILMYVYTIVTYESLYEQEDTGVT